ncbi:MAG: hypothetical protein VKL39_20850, partial [Leptolyngbyaceae bacterium]|nr:hypothetical protein [Leptolyngbyaceae bacterium]
MAILHGSWIIPPQASHQHIQPSSQSATPSHSSSLHATFFIWGEVWRRVDPFVPDTSMPAHPYSMSREELDTFIQSLQAQYGVEWPQADIQWKTVAIALPTHRAKKGRGKNAQEAIFPEHSASALFSDEGADEPKTKKKTKKSDGPTLQRWAVS